MSEVSFIDEIKKYTEEEFKKEVYIPSFDKKVKITPMLGKHQKKLIESGLDNPLYQFVFHMNCFEIIEELIGDKTITDNISIIDKIAILIQLKYFFIDESNLEKNVEYIENLNLDLSPRTVEIDGFRVVLNTPKAVDEYNLLKAYTKDIGYLLEASNNNDIRKMISDIYTIELCKYVTSIFIIKKEMGASFSSLDIKQKLDILDILSKKVDSKIRDTIVEMKDTYKEIFRDYSKGKDEYFDISVDFFN